MHQDLSDFDIPQLSLYPSTTNFWEHKRCFKKCVINMNQSYLDENEEKCSKNCLSKHIQAQIFVSQKMQHQLTQLVTQDPNVKQAFRKPFKMPPNLKVEED